MNWAYKIIRTIIVTFLALIVIVPAILYALLSVPSVQGVVRDKGAEELSKLLGADVNIGSINITPFNKLTLNDISITTAPGDTALQVDRLGAGIRLGKLILQRKIIISYAEIIGLHGNIHRDSAGAPLNIQPIIDHLKSDDKDKPETIYDLKINNIVIRKSSLDYNVDNAPYDKSKFDRNHIGIRDLRADIQVPRINNDDYTVILRRLALDERSGLSIESISGTASVTDSGISLSDFKLQLPHSCLKLDDINSDYEGWEALSKSWDKIPFDVRFLEGTKIYPPDLSPFLPLLDKFDRTFNLSFAAKGSVDNLAIDNVSIAESDGAASITVNGLYASGLPSIDSLNLDVDLISADINAIKLSSFLKSKSIGSESLWTKLDSIGQLTLTASARTSPVHTSFKTDVDYMNGGFIKLQTTLDGSVYRLKGNFAGNTVIGNTDLSLIDKNLGNTSLRMDFKGLMDRKLQWIKIDALIDAITFKGYEYSDINTSFTADRQTITGELSINDENVIADFDGQLGAVDGNYSCNANLNIKHLNLNRINLTDKYPGYVMSARIESALKGKDIENLDGHLAISNFEFSDSLKKGISMNYLSVLASGTTNPRYMLIHSDIVDGRINGNYRIKDIVPAAKCIFEEVFPALVHHRPETARRNSHNDQKPISISAKLELRESAATRQWLDFFKSPIKILHPVSITAVLDEKSKLLKASVDAPYLLQKDKFIEQTVLIFKADGNTRKTSLDFSTLYPTKNGNATVTVTADGHNDQLNAKLNWDIDRSRQFKGGLDLSAYLSEHTSENSKSSLAALIKLNPTEMVFNDTVWNVHPSTIDIVDKRIDIQNFEISRDNQYVKISGTASENPDDRICLQLLDMNLDYVFETLDIGNAMFGGIATGNFYASGLYSKQPKLETPGLHVDSFKYNFSVLGDADIISRWDNDSKGVMINASVKGKENNTSHIKGAIYPLNDSLDFQFRAKHLPVGFMKPFMEAFTSDVQGYASGDARLYGTFKYINMTGDILAEDLKLKVDVTNTYYTTTDSIHLTPGNITFGNVMLKDESGNSGRLDGWVKHHYFKEPSFHFQVTDAKNLECFNVTESINPIWYGRIFCNGSVFIDGQPGLVKINATVTTAPNSEFTFVLSDSEAASEYTFLSFNDRNEAKESLLMIVEDPVAANLKHLKEQFAREKQQQESHSTYQIRIECAVNTNGELTIISDPVARDEINARGNGDLVFEYNNSDDKMTLRGKYRLTQGEYHFSLQNLIFKKFNIKPESSITFEGDPLDAVLDIDATYSVNASLSDLDESFLQDRDVKSNNVPVHALLKVDGPLQQPNISFDLEFPTLTQDTYRKVRSIVNTDDQMSRQIIYLLTLNRFYTPDYMASTTKGNELVSVASSTLSSQLSSVLGQLSNNWSIAPNIRSDRGDFSDMQVDVALSSYLLNNRLLFNGNFGYRDNSLNNSSNTFVGDFDIEYLLNSSGNIRLKAYNRYNDQNYYVKSALTTQGIGIVFKRDFDNIFSFLRKLRRHKEQKPTSRPDRNERESVDDDLLIIKAADEPKENQEAEQQQTKSEN